MDRVINIDLLAEKVKLKRGTKGLRVAAKEIGGITYTVLHNIEKGKMPKLESYLKICNWLEVSADYFTPRYKHANTILTKDAVLKFITADHSLDSSTANAIVKIIELAYSKKN